MNSEESRLNAYKEKTKIDGEELVRNVFPKRVFEMEDILASDMFFLEGKHIHSDVNIPYPINSHSLNPGDDMDSSLTNDINKITSDKLQFPCKGSFVYALPNGFVSYNKHIKAMIEKTKPCLTQLMIEAQLVRLWVQFNIPRIEDGNNFGVGIQEEILGEASGIERDACTFLDQVTRFVCILDCL
ncbi:Proteasome activator complex subunit 3 [Schistosoma japonicum]|nr:Proteasome activator complex subunit 3 [Schistosoma japonicum]